MTFNAALTREKAPENLRVAWKLVPGDGGPIGNFGIGDVRGYVKHSIIGYEAEARPLLLRGNQRIDEGLASQEYERFGGEFGHRSDLHLARALGTWLEENDPATDQWNEANRYFEASWRSGVWTRQEIIRDGLDDFMAMAVLGGDFEDYKHGKAPFEAGIDMFEHWTGKSDVSLKELLKPRELGYVLCRHYLNHEFDRADVLAAGRTMLAANLSQPQPYCYGWLENGQTLRAAIWLKLVYWYPAFHNGEELPQPVDVLLKAYDDMPDVTRPF